MVISSKPQLGGSAWFTGFIRLGSTPGSPHLHVALKLAGLDPHGVSTFSIFMPTSNTSRMLQNDFMLLEFTPPHLLRLMGTLALESSKAQVLFSQWSTDGGWKNGQGKRTCSLVHSIVCLGMSQRVWILDTL